MKSTLCCLFLLAVVPVVSADGPPAIPATPAGIEEVVSVRPFTLTEGFEFKWSAETPVVKSGVILVLKVDPALVYPRETAEPVLYVGNQTAQRMNHGYESGYVVAIVPGEVDLTKAPIWFGTPELPERVDRGMVATERKLADKAGIKPLETGQAEAAVTKGGAAIKAANMTGLLEPVANLIEQYSPAENELVESFRAEARAGR